GGGVATGTYVQDFSFDSFSISNSNTGNNRTGNTGNNRTGNAGNNNFIGSSNNTFIGSSTAGTAANRNTTARAANMTAATRNRATNANRIPGQMGGGGTAINNRTQVQPVIVLGFTTPKADAAAVSAILSQRIEHTTQTGRLGAVQIELADGVAVARGTVASDHDRRVAVNMIRLQPGVFEIDDDIQIETPAMPRNTLSPSAGRNQQTINFDDATTPQGRPLVYVF
ncbi:MAG: hypothetical protein FWD31_05800, partial [Planctomycetaceae bacterium]|nr:hypothetical protein [Planctomycetaceae bacterium]